MEPEAKYKEELIDKLNKINLGWADGDKDNTSDKTADLVNQSLKIAIEIKDDTKYKYKEPPLSGEMIEKSLRLDNKSNQLKEDAQGANEKFRNYPNYKTILLLRTELAKEPIGVFSYIFSGLQRFIRVGNRHAEISRRNRYLSKSSTTEIGGYLLFSGVKYFYFKNPNAGKIRSLDQGNVENIFNEEIEDLQKYIT